MEPLRAFVDVTVAMNVKEDDEWNAEIRKKLFEILNVEAIWNGEKQSITNGVDQMIKSYTTACRQTDASLLLLPELVNINTHTYE
ncbi:hypothetical protein NBRC111894_4334 [Sporolactobacillus inulinus]|uniref:Uncharacterized protein n=1 Tax=Sporolactobacillus inulinus TaxID=2078 RepID=A0A4Y1ZIE3_9BACL|nr:hypothetical protein NBRC111894_4334 [Sporolactobacillus inulinus]